jgi:hypothetical protein
LKALELKVAARLGGVARGVKHKGPDEVVDNAVNSMSAASDSRETTGDLGTFLRG